MRVAIYILLLLLAYGCGVETPKGVSGVKEWGDSSKVRRGDLLFRRGRSLSSNIVLRADSSGSFSHVGLAVEIDGKVIVAHAVPTGEIPETIKIETISEFFDSNIAEAGAVYRYRVDSVALDSVCSRALDLVYSGIEFDNYYDTENQDKLYCTEFIWEAFKVIDIDISELRRTRLNLGFAKSDIILPSHLLEYSELDFVGGF